MKKIFFNNYFLRSMIFIILLISWILPFIFDNGNLIYEEVGLIIISLLIIVSLFIYDDIFSFVEIVLLVPFMFSHNMYVATIPICLIICISVFVVAMIGYIILKVKKNELELVKPNLLYGFIALGCAMIFGGLFSKPNIMDMLLLTLFLGIYLLFYIFVVSINKLTFADLSKLITILAVFLIIQFFSKAITLHDEFLVSKNIGLGWANGTNSLALIMLFTYPFTINLFLKETKLLKKLLIIFINVLELYLIVFSYSRGAIISCIIAYITLYVFLFIILRKDYKMKKNLTYNLGITASSIILLALCLLIFNKARFDNVIHNVLKINLDNFNGRKPIYEEFITKFTQKPIFGYGLLSLYSNGSYQWGHDLFIHVGYTMGIVGIISLVYHLYQKYVYLFKHINYDKVIVGFSLIASGLYGLIDVSYFFINFMIVLIIIIAISDKLFNYK